MRSGGSENLGDVPSSSRSCKATAISFGISTPKHKRRLLVLFLTLVATGKGAKRTGSVSRSLCPTPFLFVGLNLVSCRMGLLCVGRDLKRRCLLFHQIIKRDVVTEHFRYCYLFKDRLPGTLRLTDPTINALIRMDVELVGEGLPLLPPILINAVHWTDRPTPEVARQRRTPSVFKVNTQGAFVSCADRVREWLVAATSRRVVRPLPSERITLDQAARPAPQGSPCRMRPISSSVKARIVMVRMVPCSPALKANRLTVSSSGASTISTTSYWPCVQ